MKKPRVSLGMPVRNAGQYLESRIGDILSQTFSEFELLIADNCSTDSTESIARRLSEADRRIRYVRHDSDIGATSNFRYVLANTSAPYFAWAAHDDRWEGRFLERLVTVLDARPEVGLAFSRFDNIDADGRVVKRYTTDWVSIWRRPKFDQLLALMMADPAETQKANHIYGLFRRGVLEQSEELFSDGYAGSDVQHLFSVLSRSEFHVVDDVLFHYRVRTPLAAPKGAGVTYLWRRTFGSVPGHQGNLRGALERHHRLYRGLRQLVVTRVRLPPSQRAMLFVASYAGEIGRVAVRFPASILRELGIGKSRFLSS